MAPCSRGEKVTSSCRSSTPADTLTWLDSFELNARKKLTIHLAVKSTAGHGENVIGIVEGGDPVLKNEFVIMSAHLDHIGLAAPNADGDGVNNGADDDGSGSVGLLSMAHAYAAGAAKGIRPKRSSCFPEWRRGRGCWARSDFAEFPPIDLQRWWRISTWI